MAVNSETIQLLGKGVYSGIPDVLTLTSIPTASELEFVSAENFEATMLDSILPQAVQEKIDFRQLLEIDFHWICRALRILNYGPYFTTNTLYCTSCGQSSHGEYSVDLRTVDCKPLPEGFTNDIIIPADQFIDFKGDIHIKLPTIQDMLNAEHDSAFNFPDGRSNSTLARMCYMITSIGTHKNMNPVEVKLCIQKNLSSADYIVLKSKINQLADYGLRAAGTVVCPHCKKVSAKFLALIDDKFFRPTLGDLQHWRDDRSSREDEDNARSEAGPVRKNS